jgi:hypothetical protein
VVVLATKLYVRGEARERALQSLRSQVGNELDGLEVEYDVGLREDDFPSVTVRGEDDTVARNLLREEWGAITPHRRPGAVHAGTLERSDEDGFSLDAGEEVFVPSEGLGLGQGGPSQVRTRFGLVQHLPLRFVEEDGVARLADAERDRLYDWRRGSGRVNVNSATRAEVRATFNRAGHAEDVVTVERLGLLEQSVVCGEGTDPPGLIASVGRYLPSELLAVVA